jgi:heavy metal sensor kinase
VTLTTRLSLFFLATLGLVLAGFSAALYVLARNHLHRQAEERLDAALNTLVAAVEVGPDYVEWEPAERSLKIGPRAVGDQLVWVVRDERGREIDRSATPAAADFLTEVAEHVQEIRKPTKRIDWRGERWQVSQRWVRPANRPDGASVPPTGGGTKYAALTISAGVPLGPVQSSLRRLAGTLTGLSAFVWLLALVSGRWVCRRALAPVQRMAVAARAADADPNRRLPVPTSKDELEDLSRAFNGLLDRLGEAFERQRRFTGDASHQLRTPLTGLLGQIEVALRRERPAEEYRRVLTEVREQAAHLHRIVEALLFLARADAEARLPERERVELAAWLEDHVGRWSQHDRAADLRIVRSEGDSFPVDAQPALLGELVDILVENACKYSPPGSPIVLCLGRQGRNVLLTVEDRGRGIDAEELQHVCNPFYRSAEARRHGIAGLGLGLAIAKRLAEAFGGSLGVASEVGVGSRFTISLPAGESGVLTPSSGLPGV